MWSGWGWGDTSSADSQGAVACHAPLGAGAAHPVLLLTLRDGVEHGPDVFQVPGDPTEMLAFLRNPGTSLSNW